MSSNNHKQIVVIVASLFDLKRNINKIFNLKRTSVSATETEIYGITTMNFDTSKIDRN